MRKFHHKKDLPVEESPLTLQLHRRHTVVESDKSKAAEATKLKPVSRSNSTSSICKSPSAAKDANSRKGYLESTLSSSGASSASTLVITETQLSSSWLYNNKKAQMSSPKQTQPQTAQQASENEEARSPKATGSKEKSVSSPPRRSKRCSSCCCYATIVFLAGLAVLGIISAIGGIVYMEFFTETNKTQEQPLIGKSEDLSYSKKVGQSLDVSGKSQDSVSDQEMSTLSSESKQELEILNNFKHARSGVGNGQRKGSGNILRVKKEKEVVSPAVADSNLEKNEAQQNIGTTDGQASVPPSNTKSNSPYSKLFELYKDIHDNLIRIPSLFEESSSSEVDQINPKIPSSVEEISHSETDEKNPKNLDSEKVMHLIDNKTSEPGNPNQIQGDKQLRTLDVSFDSNSSLNESSNEGLDSNLEAYHAPKEHAEPAIPKYFFQRPTKEPGLAFKNTSDINDGVNVDNPEVPQPNSPLIPDLKEDSSNEHDKINRIYSSSNQNEGANLDPDLNTGKIPIGEVVVPAIPRNFFQMPSKDSDSTFRNMFAANDEVKNDNSVEQSFPRFLPHIPELSDENEASQNDNANDNPDANDKELPHELNHPVSGIAVPGPLDLLRRFTVGTETDNRKNKNNEMDLHDRRFFLAQALERLRTLDVRNILPSSRQKSSSKKNPKPTLAPKVQSEQEVVTERSSYLQKLRRRFFDQ